MINISKESQPHIVEFGCATGLMLSLIKKKGYTNLTGVDPSPSCGETAKKYYDINVLTNTFSDVALADESVDFLIMIGVLEHVRDLDTTIKKLWKLLSPNGKICIGVPDASQYYNGEDAPFQEFSVEHINFFGPVSLTNLMTKNGFAKVDTFQTSFEVNYKTITPGLVSIFEKQDQRPNLTFVKDEETKKNLLTYIELCRKKEESVNAIINKVVEQGDPIVVWGTGAQTLRLLANTKLGEAKISAFVDSNPKYQSKTIQGILVIAPKSLEGKTEKILISTRPYQHEIEREIREVLKLKNDIIKLY